MIKDVPQRLAVIVTLALSLWILSAIQVAEAKCLLLDENGDCLDEGIASGIEQSYETNSNAISLLPLLIAALSVVAIGTAILLGKRIIERLR